MLIIDLIFFIAANSNSNSNNSSCPSQFVLDLITFYQLFDTKLIWIYPTFWSLIVVRKIFFI